MIDTQITKRPSNACRVWRFLRISSVWMVLSLLRFCADEDGEATKDLRDRFFSGKCSIFAELGGGSGQFVYLCAHCLGEQIVVTHETFSGFFRLSK